MNASTGNTCRLGLFPGIFISPFASLLISMVLVLVLSLSPGSAMAEPGIHTASLEGDFATVKKLLRQELDAERFFVVKDLNIGRNLAGFANKWGDNYNRNNYGNIHSFVICNAWYVNEIINISPPHSALCPLSLSLLHKDNTTTVYYARREPMAADTMVTSLMRDLDESFIEALDNAVNRVAEIMAAESTD